MLDGSEFQAAWAVQSGVRGGVNTRNRQAAGAARRQRCEHEEQTAG